MNMRDLLADKSGMAVAGVPMGEMMNGRSGMIEERLPFTVTIVRNEEQLGKAVSIRHSAYARHVPELAATLDKPETYDYADGVIVLLAESKLDGMPIGTMRVQTNRHGPLAVEQSVAFPTWLRGRSVAEVSRFGVVEGKVGRLVKTVLVKAAFQYCLLKGIDWVIITARAPLDRLYEGLLFRDVFAEKGYIPMHHVGGIPHRVLGFEVAAGYDTWSGANHPLLGFMCETYHPDIRLGEADPDCLDAAEYLPAPFRNSGLDPLMGRH